MHTLAWKKKRFLCNHISHVPMTLTLSCMRTVRSLQETIVCTFGCNRAICLREAIFVPAQKCPYHVTFDLDLQHILDASSPGDHRVKFGRNRAVCLVVEAICAKSLQTNRQTDDGRLAIALLMEWAKKAGFWLEPEPNYSTALVVEKNSMTFEYFTNVYSSLVSSKSGNIQFITYIVRLSLDACNTNNINVLSCIRPGIRDSSCGDALLADNFPLQSCLTNIKTNTNPNSNPNRKKNLRKNF